MNDKEEILSAILSLHEATEMALKAVDNRFDSLEGRFGAHETKLDRIERGMSEGFATHEKRLDGLERQVRVGFAGVNSRLDRLERQRGTRGDRP